MLLVVYWKGGVIKLKGGRQYGMVIRFRFALLCCSVIPMFGVVRYKSGGDEGGETDGDPYIIKTRRRRALQVIVEVGFDSCVVFIHSMGINVIRVT